jgi:hypothetical protein
MASKHLWRKARQSVNSQNCVELRDTLDAVRDSKNTAGPILRGDMLALVRAVRAGHLDH